MNRRDSERLRVLLVEDDEDDYIVTRDLLDEIVSPRVDLVWCKQAEDGLDSLAGQGCDICLVDYRLGADDGIEFVAEARRRSVDIPMIMLTGADDRRVDLAAMRAGADDYMQKRHLTTSLLERVIRYSLERSREAKRRRETDARLAQAKRLESLAVVAGGVAHELNNIFGVIMADGDWATRQLNPEQTELRAPIETILAAAHQGSAVVTKLLQYAGRERLQFEALDLGVVVRGSGSVYERVVGPDINLHVDVEPDLPLVRADRNAIDGIMWSLISNARDALHHSGSIHISVDASSQGGDVRLAVADDGTGMSAQVQDRAFEPCFTTKGLTSASGMGLAMVHGLVEQHGGQVAISSKPGSGTVVSINLPGLAETSAPRPPVAGDLAIGTERTILLVEDEDALRRTARRFLERVGYRILEARDGQEALDIYHDQPSEIDLIFTDVVMPRMSGIELYEAVHQMPDPPSVLFTSGYTATEHGGPLLEAQLPLLPKPWTLDELADRVRGMLSSSGERATAS